MVNEKPIEFITGNVKSGWSKFTVRLGDKSWDCCASYIESHPLKELVISTVDIYDHIFNRPVPKENAVWRSVAQDEPGGIIILAIPKDEMVEVSVYLLTDDFDPDLLEGTLKPLPDGQIIVSYWDYAEAVFIDAARSIARHGFTGFRQEWEPCRWDIDAHRQILPIEHFLFLANLIRERKPEYALSFSKEISLLVWIRDEFKETETACKDTKPIITIMSDFGMGPYAWKNDNGDIWDKVVGVNIADSVTGFKCTDYSVPKELEEDFSDWVWNFENHYDYEKFNWKNFHERGILLAKRLKKQIGNQAIVRYSKAAEDPDYQTDEITIISLEDI
jgi:hypothetical protein